MSHSYTPTAAEPTNLILPDDGDPEVAASVNLPFETLANGLQWARGAPALASVGGRLTLSSFQPITSLDLTAQSTLYWTPITGGCLPIWNGTGWVARFHDDISISLSGMTSGKNYDVYGYWTGSAVSLQLGPAWTSDVSRSDSFFRQNGVYVRGTDHTQRYLGTIRATGTTTTEDSKAKRFVWNYYNRFPRSMFVTDSTSPWTYASNVIRQANGNTANKVQFVVGDYSPFDSAVYARYAYTASPTVYYAGIGLDSTTTFSSINDSPTPTVMSDAVLCYGFYEDVASFGYHYLSFNEKVSSLDSVNVYGIPGTHLRGRVWG